MDTLQNLIKWIFSGKDAWSMLTKVGAGTILLTFMLLIIGINTGYVHLIVGEPAYNYFSNSEKDKTLKIQASDIDFIFTKVDLNLREYPSRHSQKVGEPILKNSMISEVVDLHDTGENYFWAFIITEDGRNGYVNCRDIYVECILRQ